MLARILLAIALAVILGVPFLLRPPAPADHADADTLIVVTPHVPQIRAEVGPAFDRWLFARTGRHARIDWRIPGGTAEIIKLLQAKYNDVAARGLLDLSDPKDPRCPAGTVEFDVMLGGGSYDHGRLKKGDGVAFATTVDGKLARLPIPMSAPPQPPFTQAELDALYGQNKIGAQTLYDPDQFWLGTALSSFGIVFNRDVLTRIGLSEPSSFSDLCDPRLSGWIALADPRQAGSVATTFDSILSYEGWDRGWRILREMTANTRSFSSSSTKVPVDVSQGEAAAGLAIDFYGRAQAQAVLQAVPGSPPLRGGSGSHPEGSNSPGRVGYLDPKGSVYIDADPVSILRGAPHPDLARQFVEFCLSEEAQSLWQFPPRTSASTSGGDQLGPDRYALRRLPIRRVMYEKYFERFTDKVNPFEIASATQPKGWRDSIGVMMGAFAIDTADAQHAAWQALNRVRASSHPRPVVEEMERLFYELPRHSMKDGTSLPFTEANYAAISADVNRWRDPARAPLARIEYTKFFSANYRRIVELEGR